MSDARDRRVPGWCRKHQDFMWRYGDGSTSCRWELVVEANSDECDFSVDDLLAVLVEAGVLEPAPHGRMSARDGRPIYRRTETNR